MIYHLYIHFQEMSYETPIIQTFFSITTIS